MITQTERVKRCRKKNRQLSIANCQLCYTFVPMLRKVCCRCGYYLSLIVVSLFVLSACGDKTKKPSSNPLHLKTIMPKGLHLRQGDVVFRLGGGIMSSAVLEADPKGGYSHCGIVVDSAGTLMIVHAVPGEPDYEGDPDRVKMETPEKFFSTENAFKGEVRRPKDPEMADRAAQIALQTYKRHTLFDNDFNNEDTTEMYCTELVVHAFKQAGRPIVGKPEHFLNIPAMPITCWMPSDIYDSDFFKPVSRFPIYKKKAKNNQQKPK